MRRLVLALPFIACAHAPVAEAPHQRIAFGELSGDPAALTVLQQELGERFDTSAGSPDFIVHIAVRGHHAFDAPELGAFGARGLPGLPMVRRTDRLQATLKLAEPGGNLVFEGEYVSTEAGAALPRGTFTDGYDLLVLNARRIVDWFWAKES